MSTEHLLDEAQALVRTDLDVMERALAGVSEEVAGVLGADGAEMVKNSGKRVRGTLVLLCARFTGRRNGLAPTVAAAVELIHLATLIHDDSIDGSLLRRGRPTAHVTWDHRVATMLGDVLYSRAFEMLVNLEDGRVTREVARATHAMSRGELEEYLLRDQLPDEATYLRITRAKTAVFVAACCRVGAIVAGVDGRTQDLLERFGERIGMAFQVTDDVLDFIGTGPELGKDVGVDLRDGIATLPLIAALERSGPERALLHEEVRKARAGGSIEGVVATVWRLGGVSYAQEVARALCEEARGMLAGLAPSRAVDSLDLIAQYAWQRAR